MDLVLFGMNHTTAPLQIRELLSFNEEDSCNVMCNLRSMSVFDETLMVCTCNRTEVYGLAEHADESIRKLLTVFTDLRKVESEILRKQSYSFLNIKAVEHLFNVAAGLDSMVLGEVEILGQLKDAYRTATSVDATGPYLNRLFHHCFRVGKRVRKETEISFGGYSVGSSAVDLATKVLGNLSNKSVLLIGAGETGQLVARHLLHKGIGRMVITNRTHSKAVKTAEEFGGQTLPFDEYPNALGRFDLIITAVGSGDRIVRPEMIQQSPARTQLYIDLGVPRDIDPEIEKMPRIFAYNVDDLEKIVRENLAKREMQVPKVKKIVQQETSKFIAWSDSLRAQKTIIDLNDRMNEIREQTLNKWKRKLSPQEYEKVKRITHELVNKILYEPSKNLKGCELSDEKKHCASCDLFIPDKGCVHGHYNQELKCAIARSLFNLGISESYDKEDDDND